MRILPKTKPRPRQPRLHRLRAHGRRAAADHLRPGRDRRHRKFTATKVLVPLVLGLSSSACSSGMRCACRGRCSTSVSTAVQRSPRPRWPCSASPRRCSAAWCCCRSTGRRSAMRASSTPVCSPRRRASAPRSSCRSPAAHRPGGGPLALFGVTLTTVATIPFALMGAPPRSPGSSSPCPCAASASASVHAAMAAASPRSSAPSCSTPAQLNVLQRIGGSIGTALLAVVLQARSSAPTPRRRRRRVRHRVLGLDRAHRAGHRALHRPAARRAGRPGRRRRPRPASARRAATSR